MKNYSFILLLYIVLLAFPQMSETIISPSLPGIAASLQSDHQVVELSLSIFFAGFAAGVSFWGIGADWWGRRRALLYGLVVFSLGSVACTLSQSIGQLLTATFLQAIGASCGSVVTQTILRDVYKPEQRGQVFAIIGMALAFSPALGPFIGSLLDVSFGWRANYVFCAGLGLLLFVVSAVGIKETRPEGLPKQTLGSLAQIAKVMIRDPFIWACALLIGICNGVLFCFFGEGPFIFIEKLGLDANQYGWIGIVVSLSVFLAGSISHRQVAKIGPEALTKRGTIILALGALAYLGASALVEMSNGSGLIAALALVPSLLVLFLGMGLIISNVLSMALKNYQACVGSAGSLFGLLYYMIIALLTAGMSALHGDTILALPIYLVGLSLLGCIIAMGLTQREAVKTSTSVSVGSSPTSKFLGSSGFVGLRYRGERGIGLTRENTETPR